MPQTLLLCYSSMFHFCRRFFSKLRTQFFSAERTVFKCFKYFRWTSYPDFVPCLWTEYCYTCIWFRSLWIHQFLFLRYPLTFLSLLSRWLLSGKFVYGEQLSTSFFNLKKWQSNHWLRNILSLFFFKNIVILNCLLISLCQTRIRKIFVFI